MLPAQWQLGGILGVPCDRLISYPQICRTPLREGPASQKWGNYSAIQTLAIETNHEDLKDLKEILAGCIEGKRFCLLCMGAALRGAASLRESRGKATPAGSVDA